MTEPPQGEGWWMADDGEWYPPHEPTQPVPVKAPAQTDAGQQPVVARWKTWHVLAAFVAALLIGVLLSRVVTPPDPGEEKATQNIAGDQAATPETTQPPTTPAPTTTTNPPPAVDGPAAGTQPADPPTTGPTTTFNRTEAGRRFALAAKRWVEVHRLTQDGGPKGPVFQLSGAPARVRYSGSNNFTAYLVNEAGEQTLLGHCAYTCEGERQFEAEEGSYYVRAFGEAWSVVIEEYR